MAIPVAFYLLIAYIFSAHFLPSWGYFGSQDTSFTACGGPILMRTKRIILPTTCFHTSIHTTAFIVPVHRPWKHVCFKPSLSFFATVPIVTFFDLPSTKAMAESGTLAAPGLSTATSITSFSTKSGDALPQENYALLAKLQGSPIHAPPGPCPTSTGTPSITKTQLQPNQTAIKEAKAKAAEGKKLTTVTCWSKTLAKKQENQAKLISSAKAKAAKVSAKAKELCFKLAKVTKATVSPPGCPTDPVAAETPHSHKKSKGNAGAPSPCTTGSFTLQQSPQRKTMLANKRVNVHSPICPPARQPEELLSSDSSYLLDSSGDKVPVVDKDTDNKHETSFVAPSKHPDILLHDKRLEACGGRRYTSPLARDRTSPKAGGSD
jgi:hypothetical protein